MTSVKILIDLGKLKARYSGLGEMSYNFGKYLEKHSALLIKQNIEVDLLVPAEYVGAFGTEFTYVELNFFRRHFPFLNKRYDLWYASHQDSSYLPGNKDCRYILTVHDLNVAYHPNKEKAKKRLSEIQKKIDRSYYLTYNSYFTEKEVSEKLNTTGKRAEVIYCGCEDFSKIEGVKPNDFNLEGSYYLHISTITPKKNTKALVEMMKLMPDKKLVIAGTWSDVYAQEIISMIQEGNVTNIIRLEKVSNREKAWLYQNCEAVFFPSFLEGFGLPVIESMYCGKPVFLSTFTSLPEIGSDKAFYWDDFLPENMKDTVLQNMRIAMNNTNFSQSLKTYADTFNWDKNILKYIQLFILLSEEKKKNVNE
ncbi:MAG: hypothetical protein NVSMB45_05300 [Ginsengibacter sp.]